MGNYSNKLTFRYILFMLMVVIAIVISQVTIHNFQSQQTKDAGIINIAGRQRMLSQRIAKITLYIQRSSAEGAIPKARVDSLQHCLTVWVKNNQYIKNQKDLKANESDSLLAIQTAIIDEVYAALKNIDQNSDPALINESLRVVEANDIPFLMNMEKIVRIFQFESENKVHLVERLEYGIAAILFLTILGSFVFILRPFVSRLNHSNQQLSNLNNDLQAQDEEIRVNFEQITSLQSYLEKKEKQYRERVEESIDGIYESNFYGFFTYVNPATAKLTGYSEEELLQKKYAELIPLDYRQGTSAFYTQQFLDKREETYYEFPVHTKSGALLWVSQTVRMVFRQDKLEKVHAVVRDITDLHNLRIAQKHSEARFMSLAEYSPVGVFELNAEAQTIYRNRRWNDITGLPSDATQEERFNAIHPEDREFTLQAWRKAIEEKKEITIEFRFNNPKRGIVWVHSRTSPTFDTEGNLLGFMGTLSDVTALKETIEHLKKSEEVYRLISTNSKDLITLYNNDSNAIRTFISPSVKNILGYEPYELIGKSPFDIIIPEDVEKMKVSIHQDTLNGTPSSSEYRVRKKDGSVIWMETNSHPFFNESGELIGFQTSAREITSRKEIENQLAKSERLYRLLSENTQDMVAQHTPEGIYQFVSRSFQLLLGYKQDELVGFSAYTIIHPDDEERLRQGAHRDTLEGKSLSNLEHRLKKKDGTYIWVETYAQPIKDENGFVITIQTSSRDISQRKAYEAALTEAKAKAEEANKAKSLFLSVMSHEIRTPMNAVIGLTNFMIDEGPTVSQLKNLKLLKYSGENLLVIINDILDFSKIEAGKIELEENSFDLIELIESITKMMQHKANAKDIALFLEHDDELSRYVEGDSVRINQVLLNLIGNAIKFTEHGSVKLSVSQHQVNDKLEILFSVTDTGIGIGNDKLGLIFDSFSQATKDTTRKYGGTGLGLAIAQRLVHIMGGHLQVESEPGQGSSFYFSLLLKPGNPIRLKEKSLHSSSELSSLHCHILLVEDNPVNQVVVSNYLKKWGVKMTYAENGIEALEKIVLESFHLVLMDMQMPEMDGYEATRRIRQMKGSYYRDIPILALTASAMNDKITEMLDAGLNDFVIKPFDPETLYSKILDHISKSAAVVKNSKGTIDLSQHTLNDPESSKILSKLIIRNIQELMDAFVRSEAGDDQTQLFQMAVHKSKTSIFIINDESFSSLINELDESVNNFKERPIDFKIKSKLFFDLCQEKIKQLTLHI